MLGKCEREIRKKNENRRGFVRILLKGRMRKRREEKWNTGDTVEAHGGRKEEQGWGKVEGGEREKKK